MNSGMAIFKSETYPEFEIIDVVASKSSGESEFWSFPATHQDQISQSRNFESFFGFISHTWSGLPTLMLARCREIPVEPNHFPQSVLSWKINQSQDKKRNAFKRLTRVQNSDFEAALSFVLAVHFILTRPGTKHQEECLNLINVAKCLVRGEKDEF